MRITVRHFGSILRGIREFRRLTPAAVGQAVGVSASTISAIERGQMPQMVNFLRLCRWIGIKPSAFLDDDGLEPVHTQVVDLPADEMDGLGDPGDTLQ